MSENLMNSAHKASTPAYRDGWDRIFGASDASDNYDDMDITHAMSEKYKREYGQRCPFCGSSNIRGNPFDGEGIYVWTFIECEDCKQEWMEEFTMTSIERGPDWHEDRRKATS